MIRFFSALIVLPVCSLFAQDRILEQETEFRVKLLSPLDTRTARQGDQVTAQVLSPDGFRGDVFEGSVRQVKRGGKLQGTSVLTFTFETLHHAGSPVKVQSSVKSLANSQGKQGVDEEGRVINKVGNLKKAAAVAAAGAVIGAIAGGGKGAAIGAGAGMAAGIMLVEVGAKGPDISFAAGSEVVLAVKQR